MKVINYLICFFPYVLAVLSLYLINNLIVVKQKKDKLNVRLIIPILIMSSVLVIFYLPSKNILNKYDLSYVQVELFQEIPERISVTIQDKDKVNMILQAINNHTFTRSAIRTVQQQNFADSQLAILTTHDYKPMKIVHLYVLKDQPRINALQINDQMYNVRDKKGLSQDIFSILEEFKILDK